jgi:AGCS family alanine or glycine:cation symporter
MAFFDEVYSLINLLNDFLWGSVLVILLVFVGIFFTLKIKFVQFRMFAHAFSLLKLSTAKSKSKEHISSFEALSTSLASLVGVGSIAGMAIAISLGGPGAIFWVWVIAILGMATNFVEHTLGQIYKRKTSLNLFLGGPAYYLLHGLKNKPLAIIFAIMLLITYGVAFNSVQANTIGNSFNHAFNVDVKTTGIILSLLTFFVIFGGIKRIAKVSSFLVPLMGIIYIGLALVVIALNISKVPGVFVLIFQSAFGLKEAVAGGVSYTLMQAAIIGIKRSLFSTEAGMGSTPNISASANVKHPVQQGILGMLGVFFVAFIVCSATAFIVLLNDSLVLDGKMQGVSLVQDSLASALGLYSLYLLSFCIFVFGFTSIIGNYSYAENNFNFLHSNKNYLHFVRILVVVTVYVGTVASLPVVWNVADFFMAIMIIINLYALLRLSPVVVPVVSDYIKQLKEGKEPVFKKSSISKLDKDVDNAW